ncbi:unnamed protein product [Sphagnum tenellum]
MLLRAIRKQMPEGVRLDAYGVGGPELEEAGLRIVAPMRELMTVGFLEVLLRLPKILRVLAQLEQARCLSHLCWQSLGRRASDDFDPKRGSSSTRTAQHRPFSRIGVKGEGFAEGESASDACRKRTSEVNAHLELFLDTAALLAEQLKRSGYLRESEKLIVLFPFPRTAHLESIQTRIKIWKAHDPSTLTARILDIRVSQGNSAACLVAADVGLIKSGTSTLEAALLRCPSRSCVSSDADDGMDF